MINIKRPLAKLEMSELRKANTGHAYFVTFVAVGWIDLFTREVYNKMILNNLIFGQKNKGLEIYAYVIMPSHIHLVLRRKEGGLLSSWIRDFKSFTAKEILKIVKNNKKESRKDWLLHLFKYHAKFQKQNAEHMVWQKTNHPTELSWDSIFDQKVEYVHNNPVKAGIVCEPHHYKYSSANPFSRLKVEQA